MVRANRVARGDLLVTEFPGPAVARLPRRDRLAILIALAGVTLLAWATLIDMSLGMAEPNDAAMELMKLKAWTPTDFVFMFLMWAIMMVGMMVPTAAPMTLVYAAVARKAAKQGAVLAPAAAFVGGYVVLWCLFSLGATALQWGLDRAALLSPMLVATSPALGGGLLIAAGLYQFTPLKASCLRHCRAPAHFFAQHWRPGFRGAFRMGAVHGAFCLGCCWALMGLLFFGGVMNLLWVAGITGFVLVEKLLPFGAAGGRAAGIALMACGVAVLLGWSYP